MSVQSEISRISSAVGDAYDAVSAKGGTVPASETVANLASAIASIPSGGTVRTYSGTFNTGNSGSVDVDCGFQPDLLYIYAGAWNSYHYFFALPFFVRHPSSGEYTSNIVYGSGMTAPEYTKFSEFAYVECGGYLRNSGVRLYLSGIRANGSTAGITNQTINYTALKWTA